MLQYWTHTFFSVILERMMGRH